MEHGAHAEGTIWQPSFAAVDTLAHSRSRSRNKGFHTPFLVWLSETSHLIMDENAYLFGRRRMEKIVSSLTAIVALYVLFIYNDGTLFWSIMDTITPWLQQKLMEALSQ